LLDQETLWTVLIESFTNTLLITNIKCSYISQKCVMLKNVSGYLILIAFLCYLITTTTVLGSNTKESTEYTKNNCEAK